MKFPPDYLKDAVRITHYTISHNTGAIFDCDYKGQISSIIFEKNRLFFIKKKPLQLIRESCRYYGWSYKERVHHAKEFFKQSHKLPVLITQTTTKPCILFPLYSASNTGNAWLNLYKIRNMERKEDFCAVRLEDEWILLPATPTVFKSQYTTANLYARNCEQDLW